MVEAATQEKPETLPAEVRADLLSSQESVFLNVALFEQAQRVARLFADSTMVPDHFQKNIGNCMIGLNYAMRIKADPFMVMQSMYVVHGRPGIEGKLVEAVINASGKYSEPLKYLWLDPEDNEITRGQVLKHKQFEDYGCQAYTTDKESGERVDGPKISWSLIKKMGWYDRLGVDKTVDSNMWHSMPEMMFIYRAASWFGNKNCPELKLGMATVEELRDSSIEMVSTNGKTFRMGESPEDLTKRIKESADQKPEPEDKDPIREEYINLRTKGFKPWVIANLERIPTLDAPYRDEIASKWKSLYPDEGYVVDKRQIAATDEITPSGGENEGTEPPPLSAEDKAIMSLIQGSKHDIAGRLCVPCPGQDGRAILFSYCQEGCQERQGCPTFEEYDRAGEEVSD